MNIRRFILFIFLLLISLFTNAQKVGLVLSGGGSKGVTHIGVIRALEEAEIPIDYITGTSMGAIIGGLYASGYSPDAMEAIISSPEFEYWSTGKIDPKYSYYFKAPTKTASWFEFKFNIDSVIKPMIPTNLISPVMMDFAFLELFSSASAASSCNFDSLMVPFRCVASDISKARPIILRKGDLGKSIRASMTYPFYFKPIRIDSILLFDGGMYNNFPSDVMLDDFNPDIIIGSQAASNVVAPDENNVITHIENMLMMKTDYNVLCDNSVMIKPIIPDVNVVDFRYSAAIIDSGYVQTKRLIPEIRKFVIEHRSKSTVDENRRLFNQKKPNLEIASIKLNGLRKGQFQYMNTLLDRKSNRVKSDDNKVNTLTLNMIKPQYFKFIAEDRIGDIYPSLSYSRNDGKYDLTVDIERENQLMTQVGGAVTSSSVNELFLQLKYYLWSSKSMLFTANSYFGRFYNSALVETRLDIPAYNPFYFSLGFIYNKFNYFKTSTFFYSDEDPFFLVENEHFAYFQAGFPYKNDGKILLDFTVGNTIDKYFQTNAYTREDELDKTTFKFIAPGIIFEINSLNYKEYPTSGSNFTVSGHLINGTEKFFPGTTIIDKRILSITHTWLQADLEYENYFAKFKRIRTGFYTKLHFSTQAYFTNYTSSILSAEPFQPISESTIKFMPTFRANKFATVGSKNVYSIARNFDFRLEAYMFMVSDAFIRDSITGRIGSSPKLKFNPMATSAFVYRTPIGPLSINLNYFSGEDKPVSFFLKLGYLIFNRRPY